MQVGAAIFSFWTQRVAAREEFTEKFEQTYALAADGRLSIDNVNGPIRIATWDNAEVKVEAVKRSSVQEHLQEVKIEIESKPDRLTIHTRFPQSKSHWWGKSAQDSTSVDYILTVPRSVRLDRISDVNGKVEIDGVKGPVKASTVNGALSVKGLAANAELSTVNGVVKASFVSLESVKSVSVSSVNGAVELGLPESANADISASTVNGSIGGDLKAKKHWPVGSELKTTLGQGGAKLKASTVNGGVRIHLVKAEA
jgi:DUF4097 and DUF4098 domain-containing protein YvlB